MIHKTDGNVFDENGSPVESWDDDESKLVPATKTVHHDAVEGVEEIGHWRTVREYPETGGKDVEWVVDVPGVEAQDAWDEKVHYYVCTPLTADERAARPTQMHARIKSLESDAPALSIAFVTMAQNEMIDAVTAGEHMDMFAEWTQDVDYSVKAIVRYNGKLYRCNQAHRSQSDWTPDVSASLWTSIADPAEEWPEWSQPIGAHDAYMSGDKVTHNLQHWTSTVDNNVWEPGVYGWESVL